MFLKSIFVKVFGSSVTEKIISRYLKSPDRFNTLKEPMLLIGVIPTITQLSRGHGGTM